MSTKVCWRCDGHGEVVSFTVLRWVACPICHGERVLRPEEKT